MLTIVTLIAIFISCLFNEVGRRLKIFICFTGKSHNEVGGEVEIRKMFPKTFQDLHEGTGAVHPAHLFQDLVRAALQAEMQVGCQFRVTEQFMEIITESIGLKRRDPDPEIAR